MKNKNIIVNATALESGGALTILKQFISNIPYDDNSWVIFISDKISISNEKGNIRIEPISGVKSLFKRFCWDAFGLRRWLKKNNIDPIASISLQNTGFNVGKKTPLFIYYHQPLPFYINKWNPLKKNERIFWFYKNIYPFFVKLFLTHNSIIFVQLEYIKEGFSTRFKHPKNLIEVYYPSVTTFPIIETKRDQNESLRVFYPATPHFYKNHSIIIEALRTIDRKIEVLFTTEKIKSFKEDKRLKYLGTLPYKKVCEMYNDCDALLYPSYIETFGLPLLEAAMLGLPILAADLPYAREVLKGYDGVIFIKHDNPIAWAKAINNLKKGTRFNPINISNRSGWADLFNSIFSKIN